MKSPTVKTFTQTIPANGTVGFNAFGNFVGVLEATSGFELQFGGGAAFEVEQGLSFKSPEPFEAMTARNKSGAPIDVKLVVALGDVRDSRLSIAGGLNVSIEAGATGTSDAAQSVGAGSVVSICSASASRKEAIICNDSATETIYARFGNTAAAGGVKLAPGATAILQTTAEIYAYNPGASAADVLVSEISA